MATYKRESRSSIARYNNIKRELEASMLEYSERMRQLHATRGRYNQRERGSEFSPTKRDPVESRAFYHLSHPNDGFQQHRHPTYKHQYDNPYINRQQRPLSFDEKELQRNKLLQLQRPKRDTMSERPVVRIPSAIQNISSDQMGTQDNGKRMKINLVNASDLCDLVELSMEAKNPGSDKTKIANVEDGIQLIEELDFNSRKRNPSYAQRRNQNESRTISDLSSKKTSENGVHAIDIDNNSALLSGRKIQSNFIAKKQFFHQPPNSTQRKNSGVEQNDHEIDSDVDGYDDNSIHSLDILLQQAAQDHSNSRLKLRPKRAKRMMLHQPELLAIPEDGGTFVRKDNLDAVRKGMLKSVPLPSSGSLQAIKDTNPKFEEDQLILQGQHLSGSTKRPSDLHKRQDSTLHEKSPRKSRDKSPRDADLNIDKLMVTSIYPDVTWEVDTDHVTRPRRESPNRGTHKEKAQRKMKKLIFLRDQPEHNYRREL